MRTILLVLSEHLRLPADTSDPLLLLTAEGWPESNAVRDFLLAVSGTSVKRLTLGQRIGGEPERQMRELEESFRNSLDSALTTWYSEAVLATYKSSAGTPSSRRMLYKSRWKAALLHAVLCCWPDPGYQEIANWISENLPETELPSYCTGGEQDLGLAVRHNRDVREQFQKDLSKIKSDLRSRTKNP